MLDADFKVIVIGAGSTGLLLAQGLKKHNISCTVYERENEVAYHQRPREWGMTLHWGAESISACLPPDLVAGLNKGICCDPFYSEQAVTFPLFNAQTGEKLFEVPVSSPRRVSRRKLRTYLTQGVDVQYGKRLSSLIPNDTSVTATFTDGTQVTAPLIIGCDSVHSVVRRFLVGEQAGREHYMDVQMLNVSCSFSKEVALAQRELGNAIFKNAYHPAGFGWFNSVQDIQNPDQPETWQFQNVLSWVGAPRAEDFADPRDILTFWREKATLFAEPWRLIARDIPDDTPIRVDRVATWKPNIDWSVRSPFGPRVTIAGDAAHAMPPFRGQGLNNAIEDAANLLRQLVRFQKGKVTLETAVREYEHEMKERTAVECDVSAQQAMMVHDWDQLMQAPAFRHGLHKYREEVEARKHNEVNEVNKV